MCASCWHAPPCSEGRESSWLSTPSPPAHPDTLPQPQHAQALHCQPRCLTPSRTAPGSTHTPQISTYLPHSLRHEAHNSPVLCCVYQANAGQGGLKQTCKERREKGLVSERELRACFPSLSRTLASSSLPQEILSLAILTLSLMSGELMK